MHVCRNCIVIDIILCVRKLFWDSKFLLIPHKSLSKNWVDYPMQCAASSINSCTKLMVDKRVWQIKQGQIIHCTKLLQMQAIDYFH